MADDPLIHHGVIEVDDGELAELLAGLGARRPSLLSPLRTLVAAAGRPTRDPAAVRATLGAVDDAMLIGRFEPLLAPDRVLDLAVASWEGAPRSARMCSTRRSDAGWCGVRAASGRGVEVLGPLTTDDLVVWVRLQLELSAGAEVPVPWERLRADELMFLFALLDAHARAAHASYLDRRGRPAPVVIHLSDVLDAQADASATLDRRWLCSAVPELLDLLVHPGGRRGVGLPPVAPDVARRELDRHVAAGWLDVVRGGDNPAVTLAGPLPAVAASLGNWLQLACLHDTQVVGWSGERALAQHDAVVLIVGAAATWSLSTVDLSAAGDDLSSVSFRLNTVNLVTGERLARLLLEPLDTGDLPEALYAPAPPAVATPAPAAGLAAPVAGGGAPAAGAAPAATRPAGALPPPATAVTLPPSRPTHRVPAGGSAAWPTPDGAQAPAATLAAGLEVLVLSRLDSGWARVRCSNGYEAWVDGRRLEPL